MQRTKVLLWILLTIAAALTVSWQIQLWKHRTELERLTQQLGRFEIHDPSLTHLRRLPPRAPNIYAWRCYFPERTTPLPTPNYVPQVLILGRHAKKRVNVPQSGWYKNDGTQFQITASIRWDDQGRLQVACGTDLWRFTVVELDATLSEFLRTHRDSLIIEAAADADGQLTADPNTLIPFFRLRVPHELAEQYVEEQGEATRAAIEDIASFYLERWPPEQTSTNSGEK